MASSTSSTDFGPASTSAPPRESSSIDPNKNQAGGAIPHGVSRGGTISGFATSSFSSDSASPASSSSPPSSSVLATGLSRISSNFSAFSVPFSNLSISSSSKGLEEPEISASSADNFNKSNPSNSDLVAPSELLAADADRQPLAPGLSTENDASPQQTRSEVGELVSASVSSVLWERSCGFVVLSESFFNDCQVITEKKAKAYEFLKKFGLESESTFLTHQGTRLHCMFKNQTTLQEALDFEFPFRVVRCFGQGGTLCNHSLQKFDWLLTTYVGVRRGSNREEFVEARENIRKHIIEQAERAKCQIDFIRFATREFGHIISVAPRNQVSFRKILDGALNYRGRPMIFRAPNSSQAPKSQPNNNEIWTRFYMKHPVDMFVLKNVIGQKVPKLKLIGGLGETEDQAPSLLIHLVSESEQVASEQREQFLEAWSEICWKEHTHLVRPDRFRHDCSACGKAGHKRAKCPVAMSIRKGQAVPLHGDEKSKAPDCGSTRAWSVSRSAALSKSLQSKMESSNSDVHKKQISIMKPQSQEQPKLNEDATGTKTGKRDRNLKVATDRNEWKQGDELPEQCVIEKCEKDGNCFYWAVVHSEHSDSNSLKTRKAHENRIVELRQIAAKGVHEMSDSDKEKFETERRGPGLFEKISKAEFGKSANNEYAQVEEIVVISQALMRPIMIFDANTDNGKPKLHQVIGLTMTKDNRNRIGTPIVVRKTDAHYDFVKMSPSLLQLPFHENVLDENVKSLWRANELEMLKLLGPITQFDHDLLKASKLSEEENNPRNQDENERSDEVGTDELEDVSQPLRNENEKDGNEAKNENRESDKPESKKQGKKVKDGEQTKTKESTKGVQQREREASTTRKQSTAPGKPASGSARNLQSGLRPPCHSLPMSL